MLLLAFAVLLLTWVVRKQGERLKTAETALRGVKPLLEDIPRLSNEVRDMRETLDELPLDELREQAAFEKSFADRLEEIANYDLTVAMGGGESE